jgi:hypothetical protein
MTLSAKHTANGKSDISNQMMKDKTLNHLFFFIGFLALVFYYGLIHPLVPFDTDDWMNMTISRPLYPSLHCWNPTKVFPERLEPAVAMIAARFIAPVIGDYVNALILANAVVLSFFITIYLFLVQRLLTDRFHLSLPSSFCFIVFFAILHFLALKTKVKDNDYLWYAEDCNCYYHYIISNLLNASLVLWLMRHDAPLKIKGWRFIVLVIATYFALCSNLYSTIILISYAGASLLFDLIVCKKKEDRWLVTYVHQHAYFLIVLLLWLVVQLIEVNGNRANAYGHVNDSLIEYLLLTIRCLFKVRFNIGVIAFLMLALLGAKILYTLSGHHRILHIGKRPTVILLAAILSLTYLILLSAKVKPENILKGQIIFSWVFYILLLSIFGLSYLGSKIKSIRWLVPFAIILVAYNNRDVRTEFLGVQCLWGTNEYECIYTNRDIINQVRYAEALGQNSVVIYVPKFDLKDNWPLAFDCGFAVGKTLRKHNVVRRHLKTSFELDEQPAMSVDMHFVPQ